MITRIPAKGDKQASTSQGKLNASNEESSFKLFSESDIMIATNNLSNESTIGRGGFGNVYKGTIVNAEVAIKVLDTKGTQGANEFIQEMAVLKDLKHENLVKLMGACLELRALVYEFLPRGSLEDCLNNSPQVLTWHIRTRIVYEICSVLMFIHSMKPKPVVHGDLKPHNILLDADLHCRLSDFGLCRFLPEFSETTGAYLQTKSISGTECYIDPDYVEHGKITPGCDVFSFGVTILRILTRQRPFKIRRKIRKAIISNSLMTIVDSTAGDWPIEVAEYLAKAGLDCCKENRNNLKIMTDLSTFLENLDEKGCCEMSRKCQPDLVGEVPRVLEPTTKANSSSVSTLSSGADNENNSPIPSYFLCQENEEIFFRCISQDLGFSSGRPVAACVIYKCLLHWRSFEVEKTSVFDRIIQVIDSSLKTQDNNDDVLSYWLSNSSMLSLLLQRRLKASRADSLIPQRRTRSPGRMVQLGGLNDLCLVEAKYPALLFKRQLIACLEKVYGMIRENLKKKISPLLGSCILAPRTSRAIFFEKNAMQSIVQKLTNYLKTLQDNFVPPFLVRKVFTQVFSFINVQLFNSLLLRRECCSFSNGEYVKAGLADLERWCFDATEEYSGSAWDELKHIRQAVRFLVKHHKPKMTLKESTNDLCPVLSVTQLYRIATMYWDDKYGTRSVSSDVISSMRVLMAEDANNAVSSTFLLDDDSSIPFTVDEISKSTAQMDVSNVDPPLLMRENSGFSFLFERAD